MRAARRRVGARRFAVLVAAAMTVALMGGVSAFSLRERASVSLKAPALRTIEGGKVLDGGYLSESDRAGIRLFFDEGSRFVLSPGTRGRLRVAETDGVRLGIEHGSASLRITHHPEHRWSVEAGPFLVTVKGTDFSVSWDPTSERFELGLRRGRVTVSGPIVGERLALKAGQKLSVNLPKAETIITEDRADDSPALSSAVSVPASPPPKNGDAGVTPGRSAEAAPASRPAADRAWRDALKNGDWDAILDDAERKGIDATLEKASSEDLFALADAARYRRRIDLARAALLAQRRRFPSSPRSVDALFLLGRVEELRASGRAPALGYYDEYLSRAPAGTYAAEALGRTMILTKETAGSESARAIAAEYLQRFPQGSYAGAARALQRTPPAPP
jgi:TolA-binding protein